MRKRLIVIAALITFGLALQACANTRPTYYESYPAYSGGYGYGPGYGYEPYAYAPYDPYGGYYQNFYQTPRYDYEPAYNEHECDYRPCVAPPRPLKGPEPIEPKAAQPPSPERHAFSPPSTTSGSVTIEKSRAVRETHGD